MPAKPFRARKTRQRAPEPTHAVGQSLVPSAAIEEEYRKEIFSAVMEALQLPGRIGDAFTRTSLANLKRRAYRMAAAFTTKVNRHSRTSVWASIEKLGKTLTVGSVDVKDLAEPIRENVSLITNLTNDAQEKLTELYIKHGPDQSKIYPELEEMVGNRAKLISTDQNAKLFTSLNTERMIESGLDTFEWQHSSAGKTPRQCHVDRNGQLYLLKGGSSELYHLDGSNANDDPGCRKGDIGKPGYAINCRCRMKPTSSLDD